MSAYSAAVLADSPTAYWRLGESVGATTAADSSGNGHTGTVGGTVTFGATGLISGDSDTAITTGSGAGSGLSLASSADWNMGTGDFTVEAWVKTTLATTRVLFAPDTTEWCGVLSGYPALSIGGSNASSGTPITNGVAHHLVFMRRAGAIRIYVDNVLVYGPLTNSSTWGATGPATVANLNGSFNWQDTLDEVAVWKGLGLSNAQVAAHYAAGTGGGGGSLAVGTLTLGTVTSSSVTVSIATDGGGTSPYSNQLQRSPASAGTWTNTGSPVVGTTASFTDSTVVAGTSYDYRVVVTDSAGSPATGNSNTVTAAVPAFVVITTGNASWFWSPYNWA